MISSQGNWPNLKSLDITGNCLNGEAMAMLVKGIWPRLVSVALSF